MDIGHSLNGKVHRIFKIKFEGYGNSWSPSEHNNFSSKQINEII
jgi:hypothetical protein